MLLRCTIVTSATADGDVVRVPRSETERTPRIISARDGLGITFGGGEAASAKGCVHSIRSRRRTVSKVVRIVESVPPLGPELLHSEFSNRKNGNV